jgi:hypothetical protein
VFLPEIAAMLRRLDSLTSAKEGRADLRLKVVPLEAFAVFLLLPFIECNSQSVLGF